MDKISIFWFRRDIRIEDNHALFRALNSGKKVMCIFIFDTRILSKLRNKDDKRVGFIFEALNKVDEVLKNYGSSIQRFYGEVPEVFQQLIREYAIESVYTNHDYEPYALNRDQIIAEFLESKNIAFHSFKDQVIFEKNEVVKDDGKPYTVFTPYSVRWKKNLRLNPIVNYASEKYLAALYSCDNAEFLNASQIGFDEQKSVYYPPEINKKLISEYAEKRDFPALDATSRLSVHLRFGTISIRKLVAVAMESNEIWLNELIWREFYMMILYHFPRVENTAFKSIYDRIIWKNDEQEFKKWCEGKTGFPIVDAGMRELNATGFMHNRLRMIAASFLVKHLLIDWRWGEAYFAEKLLDFDLAANNGGWQWAASTGCDAVPYFRIFNPWEQTKKFDKELRYIQKWVPEFQDFSYPKPMLDHSFARQRALETFKKALQD